ncbi:hypothetical protein [Brucella cytisi]|uniref:hypothetical protein n=1 Tax=Brucella cytisi TaxID=407152 RepID=UPI00313CBC15
MGVESTDAANVGLSVARKDTAEVELLGKPTEGKEAVGADVQKGVLLELTGGFFSTSGPDLSDSPRFLSRVGPEFTVTYFPERYLCLSLSEVQSFVASSVTLDVNCAYVFRESFDVNENLLSSLSILAPDSAGASNHQDMPADDDRRVDVV